MALCPQLGCDPKGDLSFEDEHFRGPCADCCKPLAQSCCCVSADGEAIFCCVPTDREYHLPACLHMALCPQLGCDPRGGDEKIDFCIAPFIFSLVVTPFVCCFQGSGQGFHPGISCDRSGMYPIVGMRFHLRGSEPSYDLCQAEYDKLDVAEKGQYEAIPPPPPGLKLQGGSLPGAAAKYMGRYRLDRRVNGRPAYQHVTDGSRWIAFAGDRWMGQPESFLGEKKGNLDLTDSAAASPDVSTVTWKANAGGAGAEWVEAPQLKIVSSGKDWFW
jgi:hypothetical protein